jgi:GrpB-like predicted nucleotidyltransferase (UPF0157 family)
MRRTVRAVHLIREHESSWAALYLRELAVLRPIFPNAAFEHVGSTAVPGLPAKPVIDILVGLSSVKLNAETRTALRNAGYVARRRDTTGRSYFRKGNPRTHYLHVVELDGASWRRYLAFRNRLREKPEETAQYAMLKRELALADIGTYARAKAAYIDAVLKRS